MKAALTCGRRQDRVVPSVCKVGTADVVAPGVWLGFSWEHARAKRATSGPGGLVWREVTPFLVRERAVGFLEERHDDLTTKERGVCWTAGCGN